MASRLLTITTGCFLGLWLVLVLHARTIDGFQHLTAPTTRSHHPIVYSKSGGKRRKRRKEGSLSQLEELAPAETAPPADNVTQFIVDEPGKLVGKPLDDARAERREARADIGEATVTLEKLKRNVANLGGKRPDDPSDAFDYGFGGLIKTTVFVLSGALIAFDLYINSPFFQRAAPSPVVSAVSSEFEKLAKPDAAFVEPELRDK